MLKDIFYALTLSIVLLFGINTAFAISVDTSLLIDTDVDTYDMGMKVESVTEDTDTYYVTYTYDTLEAADSVWQVVHKTAPMKVSKTALGTQDLGLYAAKQMDQVVAQEKAYLKTVQAAEKNTQTAKTNTEYSGIVGQSLDRDTKTFEGYQPVKPAAAAEAVLGVEVDSGTATPETVVVSSSPAFDTLSSRVDSLDEKMRSFTDGDSGLSSKVSMLEEKLQALTDLVATLTEFYTTFNLDSLLGKDGA